MVTACSTFAEDLLSPSPVPPALLLGLRQLEVSRNKALRNNTNLEGEWTSIFSARSTTSPSQGKMQRNHSKPWHPNHTWTRVPTLTPAHVQTWSTLCLYPGDREGQYGLELPTISRSPEPCPAYVKDPHLPEPTYGALDRTAELLAKLLSGSEDPDVTALSEAVKAKLGITERLPKPALASFSPGLSTLAEDLKRSMLSRLLPKVTCPSPFHPPARTVAIAELQDVPVTETKRNGLTALAPLAGVPLPPSGLTSGGGKIGNPIALANIQLELPEFDPKNLPERAEKFAGFLLLTGQSHVDVATKCSTKFLQKQVKQIMKTCSTWAEVLQRLEKTFPVYDTDLSVRTQIEELRMLPEFPSAARVS